MVFEVKIKFTNFSLGAQELITSKTTHAFEQFYLVQGGLRVVRGALHHLQGDELLISGRGERGSNCHTWQEGERMELFLATLTSDPSTAKRSRNDPIRVF